MQFARLAHGGGGIAESFAKSRAGHLVETARIEAEGGAQSPDRDPALVQRIIARVGDEQAIVGQKMVEAAPADRPKALGDAHLTVDDHGLGANRASQLAIGQHKGARSLAGDRPAQFRPQRQS